MEDSTYIGFAQTPAGETIIRVQGRATMLHSQAFQEFVDQCLSARGAPPISVSLQECEYLDSTFLGCLLTLHQRFGSGPDEKFRVVACEASRERLLRGCRLDQILNLRESIPDVATDWGTVEFTDDSDTLARHVMECHRVLAMTDGPLAAEHRRIADRLDRELSLQSQKSPD